ncbi:MAG: type I 3-dehydroquinate dehydratase [Lachnospiraceae bacterium]|nr:type I 3-dehydroquinate dehydratase [Lachnospiraceae bacterium]
MNRSIASLAPPVLAGIVREKTPGAAKAAIRNCFIDGAGMIDLHLSCFENADEEALKTVFRSSPLPVMALHYNAAKDGHQLGVSEEERTECLLRAARAGASAVDMQGYTFDLPSKTGFFGDDSLSFTKGRPNEVVMDPKVIDRQLEFMEKVRQAGAEVLISCHTGIPMDRHQVVDLALFLEKRRPDVLKIVTTADTEEELLECFHTMRLLKKEVETPVAFHASEKAGRLSRIINPFLGGHLVFCVDRYEEGSVLAQPDLKTAKSVLEGLRLITS